MNFVFIAFSGFRVEILLKKNSFKSTSHCMWYTKKPNSQNFSIFFTLAIYYSSPFIFSKFRSTFFLGIPFFPVIISAYTCLNVSPKKSSKTLNLFKLHKKMKYSIKDFFSKCDQIRRKLPYV